MVKQLGLKSKSGAIINSVEPDSPAEQAKLKQYDVIVAVNGEPVKNGDDLRFKIADIAPGKKVDLAIVRDGKEMKVTAIVDELEPEAEKGQIASPDKDIGVSVVALTPTSARRYGLRTTEGLLITEVRPGSEAARENLAAGMIIVEVNRKRVTAVRDFEDILKKTASGDEVILLVRQEVDRTVPGLHRHGESPLTRSAGEVLETPGLQRPAFLARAGEDDPPAGRDEADPGQPEALAPAPRPPPSWRAGP
ncbi:MAG: PDZ domain-containing protein [Candidatus Moduliflexus flocculans]|nr:PDZ domain-containing protein [Candidatus Moduliflexus flocculans]